MAQLRRWFSKPFGPPKEGRRWASISSRRPDLLCQLCGTSNSGTEDEPIGIIDLLGRQVVEECCGGIFDKLYDQLGAAFAEMYLEEFLANPTEERFRYFRELLAKGLPRAARKAKALADQVEESAGALSEQR